MYVQLSSTPCPVLPEYSRDVIAERTLRFHHVISVAIQAPFFYAFLKNIRPLHRRKVYACAKDIYNAPVCNEEQSEIVTEGMPPSSSRYNVFLVYRILLCALCAFFVIIALNTRRNSSILITPDIKFLIEK